MLQTEFQFSLPHGYVDDRGNLHRDGTMRLATALDEIEPAQDQRAKANELYTIILLLSRVVTRLGNLSTVGPAVIEKLFSADFAYLQTFYLRINQAGAEIVETRCPECGKSFALDLTQGDRREAVNG